MIEFTKPQVEALLEMFGGDDETMIAVERWGDEAHSGSGLYGYHSDYPNEGSILLDPPAPEPRSDDEPTI